MLHLVKVVIYFTDEVTIVAKNDCEEYFEWGIFILGRNIGFMVGNWFLRLR